MGRLLLGNAQGYAIEEITYSDQAVTFRGPSGWITTMGMTPCHQEFVHNKHTRWNLGHGELLELDTGLADLSRFRLASTPPMRATTISRRAIVDT